MDEVETGIKEIKSIQRAMCGKCGKSFINKKGVKQHILRMHVGKTKLSDENSISAQALPVSLEEEVVNTNQLPMSRLISVFNSPNYMVSPAQKKMRREEGLNEDAEGSKENSEFIKNLLVEIQDDVIDKIHEETGNNYQCGECGKFFGFSYMVIVNLPVLKITLHLSLF